VEFKSGGEVLTHKGRESPLLKVKKLIEKDDVSCPWRKALGVHQHAVPNVKDYGLVVGMPDTAANIHGSLSLHPPPGPMPNLGLGPEQRCILISGQTVRISRTHVNKFSSSSIEELAHVRFATKTATDWFISDN
jgi:hypothetical protein